MKKTILLTFAVLAATCLAYTKVNAQETSKYDKVYSFSEGFAITRLDAKYGFINKLKKEIVPPKYDGAEKFSDGMAIVKLNYKYGFINTSGAEVISPTYDDAGSFSEGIAKVKTDGLWGYVGKQGGQIVPPKYSVAESFSEGLAVVGQIVNGQLKYGFIDKTGKLVIPLKFDGTGRRFLNGTIKVEQDGEWFKIDKTGKRIE